MVDLIVISPTSFFNELRRDKVRNKGGGWSPKRTHTLLFPDPLTPMTLSSSADQ